MPRSRKSCCSAVSQRWIFAIMASLGCMNIFTMRTCLSLAITEITATTQITSNGTSPVNATLAAESISSSSSSGSTHEWDEYTQGLILSSFYWGFVISHVPGIYLVKIFGGKWVFGLSILSTAIFTLLTPAVIEAYGSTGLIVLRTAMGIGEAGTSPAAFVLISRWAPPNERSKITTVVMSGLQLGTIFGSALSGVLIKYSSIGWPMAFYVFGAMGVLWFFAFSVLCYDDPDSHPFISPKEKNYIHETIKNQTHHEMPPIPWRHIATSVPAWACIAGRIALEWIFQVMIIDLPKYMSDVLKFSVEANGFLLALPNAVMWILSIVYSWFADWLIKNKKTSRTNVRKIFATVAIVGPAISVLGASYAEYDYAMVVFLFTASMGMMGAFHASISVNAIDLSPNHSGTLASISSIIASLCGLMVPYSVGVLTPNQALLEWRTVFWMTFVVLCTASLIFNTWGNGEIQYWNDLEPRLAKHNGLEHADELSFLANTTETHKECEDNP